MPKFIVIVNMNLEYEFDVEDEDDAIMEAQGMVLPSNYVPNSFEVKNVFPKKDL